MVMAESDTIFDQSVKHKGFFNYTDLYNFCFNWFKDNGYKLFEKAYTEKLSSFGKEVVIEWNAKKKISDYFRLEIKAKWHILGMNDAEIMIEDRKEKTNKGEVKIAIKGELVRDYEENWDKTPFYKFLRGIYDKYIIRTTMDDYEDKVMDDATDFYNEIKAFLNLEGKS